MKLNLSSLLAVCLFAACSVFAGDVLDGRQLSYNTFGIRKSIYVPKVPEKTVIRDFDIFFNGKRAIPGKRAAGTCVELSRDAQWLYLHIIADEPRKVRDDNKTDLENLWRGDLFEIFFGDVEPHPWCMQFVVGAGGGRFSDAIPLSAWRARSVVKEKGYELFVSIPLKTLKKYNSGIGFNISRQRYRELSTWSMVSYGFHEPENFGELLLDDYEKVFENRYGVPGQGIDTREKFEKAVQKRSIPATALRYGPRLLYPEKDKMTVSWESCGRTFGFVEFRKAGAQKFQRIAANVVNGVPVPSKTHRVVLAGLEPDTAYEYKVGNRHPVSRVTLTDISGIYRFRTNPVKEKDFTCVIFCDAHAGFEKLGALLRHPEIIHADMVFNLGDMHSMFTGSDAVQRGFLNVQTKHLKGERPLIFVRGNHEVRGVSNGIFDSLLGHHSGKSHFVLRYGDVAFMIVDTGDPQFDIFGTGKVFRQRQKEWIRETLDSAEFSGAAFKVLLCHIPPTDNRQIKAMFDGCFQKAQPDLMLSGHVHRHQFFKAGEYTPFPLCVGFGALILKSTQDRIELISVNWQGKIAGSWIFNKKKGQVK